MTPPSPSTTYLFAGGGTGGHLYPGLAIARAVQAIAPSARSVFLCSDRAIDAKILTEEGVEFRPTPARPFGVRPRQLIRFLNSWGRTVRLGRQIIRDARARGPVHVVAMGGFVAAPIVQAARVERTPATMVNLDAVPGKANKLIAGRIAAAAPPHNAGIYTAVSVPPSHAYAQSWTNVPPIVRPAALARGTPADCRRRLGLDADRPTLMVTGGSLGASTINTLLHDFAKAHPGVLKGWQVLHQTGDKSDSPTLADALRAAYTGAGAAALVVPFVSGMGDWWGAADLAVSRAGAGSVAEAWANTVPTLFLPYPHHKDEHQRHNGAHLEHSGGAVIATDHITPAANLQHTAPILSALLADAGRRDRMRSALRTLGPANGAEQIARALLASPAPPRTAPPTPHGT